MLDTLLYVGLANALGATVLALVAAGVAAFCRRPALTHGLWLLVLLKLVAPPLWGMPLPGLCQPPAVLPPPAAEGNGAALQESGPAHATPAEQGREEPTAASTLPTSPAPPADRTSPATPDAVPEEPVVAAGPRWQAAAAALWLAGSVLWWGLASVRIGRLRRLLRNAQPPPAAVQERVRFLASQLGLTRGPDIGFVAAPVSPLLWALWGRPRLLLPTALWQSLGEPERETLLAHELAHLRRRDNWVRRLEFVVLGLYWWLPTAWWARQALQEAEEQCCDAWVVWALPGAAEAYAAALVGTLTFLSRSGSARPAGASGMGQVRLVKRRLTMILRGSTPRTLSPVGWMALLTFGALLLPLTPIRGQDQPVPEGAKPKLEGPPNEGTAPDISAAKAALERAAREVERQRAELEEAERRLKKAMAAFEPRQARPEGAARAKEFALSKKEFVPDHVLDVLKKGGQVTLRRGPEGDLLYQIDQEKPDRAGDGGRHRMPGMPGGQPGSMMPGMPGMAGMGMPGMPGMPMPGTGMPGMDTGGMRPGMPGMAGMSGMMGKGPGGAGNRSPVQRLNALEKQVKALLAEMESLRHELHPEKPH